MFGEARLRARWWQQLQTRWRRLDVVIAMLPLQNVGSAGPPLILRKVRNMQLLHQSSTSYAAEALRHEASFELSATANEVLADAVACAYS